VVAAFGGGVQIYSIQSWRLAMPVRIEARVPHKWAIAGSFVLVILALLGHLTHIPYLSQYDFWVATVGYAVLLVAALY
jgi:hypothetical protein